MTDQLRGRSQAIVAASVACRTERPAWRNLSVRVRALARDRTAASSMSGWARSESVRRGGSATPPRLARLPTRRAAALNHSLLEG